MSLLHDLRTVFHLSREVTAMRARVDELELDWLDKRDALDRILRRLTMRDVRTRPEENKTEGPGSEANGPWATPSNKEQLRAAFREVMRR